MDIEDRPALARASAYAIIEKTTGRYAGKILFALPKSGDGKIYASLWCFGDHKFSGLAVQDGWVVNGHKADALDGMEFGADVATRFKLNGEQDMRGIEKQFEEHGYNLFWVV